MRTRPLVAAPERIVVALSFAIGKDGARRCPMTVRVMSLVVASTLLAACAPEGRSVTSAGSPTARSATPTITEEEARQELADQGYGEVYDLRPQPDGSWIGSAMLGGRQRQVIVGADGSVAAQ
jgi:hypothetical protein